MNALSSGSDNTWLRNLMPHFLEQTRERLSQIEAHCKAMRNGSDPKLEMQAICDIAHKISGTADTFGFTDLGEFARNVETQFALEKGSQVTPMASGSTSECAVRSLIDEMKILTQAA